MELIIDRQGEIIMIKLSQKLDSLSAPKVEKELLPEIQDMGKYIVDMSGLTHISSAGLRVFLLAAKKVRATQSRMILCQMSETIHEIFDIAGFSSIFEIVDTEQEALNELA